MRIIFSLLVSILLLSFPGSAHHPEIVDESFHTYPGADSTVWASTIQSDGKIWIGGDFTKYNDTASHALARLHPSGYLDTSFHCPAFNANTSIRCLLLLPDGKIMVGGQFSIFYNGQTYYDVVRLYPNGSLDTNFKSYTNINGIVLSLARQSSNRIILGGTFVRGIMAYTANGNEDLTFQSAIGTFNRRVNQVLVLGNDKILIAGNFTSYNNVNRRGIARLQSNGSLDTGFDPGTGIVIGGSIESEIHALAQQTDNKILIGGYFFEYNGVSVRNIARLEPDGTLDLSFDAGTGAGGNRVYAVFVQPDQRIVLAGDFFDFNGSGANNMVRITSEGAYDKSMMTYPYHGLSGPLYTMSLQADSNFVIGGKFSFYNEIDCGNVARIWGNKYDKPTTPDPDPEDDLKIIVSENGKIEIRSHSLVEEIKLHNVLGQLEVETQSQIFYTPSRGVKLLMVKTPGGWQTHKIYLHE